MSYHESVFVQVKEDIHAKTQSHVTHKIERMNSATSFRV